MRRTFVDTSYLIALFNRLDTWHDIALQLTERIAGTRLVTTLLVLEEFLTDLSKRDATLKSEAAAYAERLLDDADIEIVEVSRDVFLSGLDLYRHRLDKSYSMVDCISMAVCRAQKITEVLTADRDFEQERFVALLRR